MRIATLVVLLGCLAVSFAGDCMNPQLAALAADGKVTALTDPIMLAETDITYCKSVLADGTARSCCSAADINKVQTMQDEMKDKFQTIAMKRDRKMKRIQEKVAPLLQSAVENLTSVVGQMPTDLAANLTARCAPIKEFMSQMKEQVPTIKADFATMQTARATCFKTMMDLQGAAFCLACDANYASRGVDATSGNITMSTETCTRIKNACYDFVTNSAKQGQMQGIQKAVGMMQGYAAMGADLSGKARPGQIQAGEGFDAPPPPPPTDGTMPPPPPPPTDGTAPITDTNLLSGFNPDMLGASSTGSIDMTNLESIAKTDPAQLMQSGIVPVQNFNNLPKKPDGLPDVESNFQPADDTDRPPKVPASCTSKDTCDWLCTNAFQKGKTNPDRLGQGGEVDQMDDGTALPEAAPAPAARLLAASSSWAPAEGEAGTNTDVSSDPAAVSSTDDSKPASATNLLFKAFSCLVLIAMIMI